MSPPLLLPLVIGGLRRRGSDRRKRLLERGTAEKLARFHSRSVALAGRARGRRPALADAHRLDAVLAHRLDPDRVAVGLDRVAAARQAAQLVEDEAADRVVGVGVDGQVQPVVEEVGHRDVAAHEPVAVGQAAHLAAGRVGLVGDLADDLLDDVLDGHDSGDAAVLVDHDRHRRALALEVGEEVVERLRLRDDRGVPDERLDRRVRALGHELPRERVRMDDPAHAVLVLVLGHDEPRMARGHAAAQGGLDVLGGVDRHDRRDRRHDLPRLLLVQVEDAREHPRLARVERAGRGDERLELLGRVALLGDPVRIDADPAQDPVTDAGQDEDERREQPAEEPQRGGDPAGDALGAVDRVELGDELAGDDVRARDDEVGDRPRHGDGEALAEPFAEDRLERLGEDRLAERADADRGHRDPDLDGRDVVADLVDLVQGELGAAQALVAHGLEARSARADQRVLAHDEERVERDQQRRQDEQQRRHRGAACEPLLRGRSSGTGRSRVRLPAGVPVTSGGQPPTGVPYAVAAKMRIVSLVPHATELLFALGLGSDVVAVTHECDFPAEVRDLPQVTRDVLPPGLAPAEIDAAVRARPEDGQSIYELDEDRLAELEPDLIVTQQLCLVCAVSYDDVVEVAKGLPTQPKVISLDPHTLGEAMGDIRTIAQATGVRDAARELVTRQRARIDAVRRAVLNAEPVAVAALEWLAPVFIAGHWTPQIVELAGGRDVLGFPGEHSEQSTWEMVTAARPEVVVVMPCGYDGERALEEARRYGDELRATGARRIVAVDAAAYFSRPGPRLVDGLELMAHVLHPDLVPDAPAAVHEVEA